MDYETVSRDIRGALGGMALLRTKENEIKLDEFLSRTIQLSQDWTKFSNSDDI